MCIICRTSNLDDLIGLKELYCWNCTSLTEIPIIDGLQKLSCRNCTSLTEIPIIDGLQRLSCDGCTSITEIPIIDGLQILYCWNCTSLTEIPIIDGLQELNCWNCTSLTTKEPTIAILNNVSSCKKTYNRTKIAYYVYRQLIAKLLTIVLPRYPVRTIISFI
jgi:hypothetical protein